MEKPIVHFASTKESGNIFWIIGACNVALHKQQRITDYNQMRDRILNESRNYDESLAIVREYVNLIDDDGRY